MHDPQHEPFFHLVEVEPTDHIEGGIAIACGRAGAGCEARRVAVPVYPRAPERDTLFAAVRALGAGDWTTARWLGLSTTDLRRLRAGALVPAAPEGWRVALERVAVASAAEALALLSWWSLPEERRGPRCGHGYSLWSDTGALCLLPRGHRDDHVPTPPERWPTVRMDLPDLLREFDAAGIKDMHFSRDVAIDCRERGTANEIRIVGMTAIGRRWAWLRLPRGT